MAIVCKLTDGTAEIALYYSETVGFSLLDEGIKPGRPEPRTLYGGIDEIQLVRHHDGKRRIPLDLYLKGDTDDDLIDRINELQHLVRQARDFHLLDYGNEVFLEFQLENATYASRFPVLGGEANIDRFMNLFCEGVQTIDSLPLVLTCKPYWVSVGTYTLENYLGTPHFEEDGNADGLADRWAEVGVPTTTLDTTIRILTKDGKDLGTQSQKVVTDDSSTEGIESDVVSAAETSAVIYAWIYLASGDDITVVLWDNDASESKGSAEYSTEGWETKVGADGNTWKRVVVSSDSLTSENDHSMIIARYSGDATQITTFYVDQCYFEFGTTTTPIGWMSGRDIDNCYDYLDTTRRINYVDVADIPGGIDALTRLIVKNVSGASQYRVFAFMDDAIARYQAVYEAEDINIGGSDNTEAGNSGGKYNTSASISGYVINPDTPYRIDFTPTTVSELRGAFKILGRTRDEQVWPTTGLFRWRMTEYQSVYAMARGSWVEGNGKELLDFGTVRLQPGLLDTNKPVRLSLALQAARQTGEDAFTIDVDYFILMPLYQAVIAEGVTLEHVVVNNDHFVLDSIAGVSCTMDSAKAYEEHSLGPVGDLLMLPPRTGARIYFLVGDSGNDYEVATASRVSFEYRTRGVHLRGTE